MLHCETSNTLKRILSTGSYDLVESLTAMSPVVLIASEDVEWATGVAIFIEGAGNDVHTCQDAKGVLRLVRRLPIDVLVLDLGLCTHADLDLISYVRRQRPATRLILMFETDEVDRALEGIRQGSFFYLPKSCQPSDVALMVAKAIEIIRDKETIEKYEENVFEEMAGNTPAMKRVAELVRKVAPTDSTVLLLGESGTGKEVLADTIHRLSPRREKPFVAINCAALPEQLLESELFGHVKGAFTGAESDKTGLFEEAEGGTVFLDEIGELSLVAQAKLLRVLQNGEIRRVGAAQSDHVDVRILAATNRNLVEAVAEGAFREDVYFRLNVIQIAIPPLRERRDAISALVKEFLKRYNARFSRRVQSIDDQAWVLLQNYGYPGNIRELESTIAHAVIMAEGDVITVNDLPDDVRFGGGASLALPHYDAANIPTLENMEKDLIETALRKLNGNQTEAAKALGVSRSTLWRKMKEYGISKTGQSREEAKTVSS